MVDGEKPGVDFRDEWKHTGVEGTICLPSGRSVLRVNQSCPWVELTHGLGWVTTAKVLNI